ncbi:MAG TPA: hypothetical protein DCZ94_17840 [Lentisphaeria bacterium]|nr:MAG: hypothetical protein A2X48_03610 [Lentisphaerae bacterium GWF2_49_21]HBC88808.1 hypothetical protein [Lentisphaeria bacterium]
MSVELKISLCILFFIILLYLFHWFSRLQVKPDPWTPLDKDRNDKDGVEGADEEGEGTPVCIKCLRPVDGPAQHYCPKCGNVTGEYTRYIPFLDIPFNYSIYPTLWSQLKSDQTAWYVKLLNFFFIIVTAPVMILIGIPLWLFWKLPIEKAKKLYKRGQDDKAFKIFMELAQKGEAEAQYYVAEIYAEGTVEIKKDYGEAEKWYLKAIENGYDGKLNLSFLWAEQGIKLDEALKFAMEAVAEKPNSGEALDTLGWILYKQGNYSGAVEQLEKALAVLPDEAIIRKHLSEAYLKLGEEEKAKGLQI